MVRKLQKNITVCNKYSMKYFRTTQSKILTVILRQQIIQFASRVCGQEMHFPINIRLFTHLSTTEL